MEMECISFGGNSWVFKYVVFDVCACLLRWIYRRNFQLASIDMAAWYSKSPLLFEYISGPRILIYYLKIMVVPFDDDLVSLPRNLQHVTFHTTSGNRPDCYMCVCGMQIKWMLLANIDRTSFASFLTIIKRVFTTLTPNVCEISHTMLKTQKKKGTESSITM
jgi:hypothetical protein